jgi:hypothetical protein
VKSTRWPRAATSIVSAAMVAALFAGACADSPRRRDRPPRTDRPSWSEPTSSAPGSNPASPAIASAPAAAAPAPAPASMAPAPGSPISMTAGPATEVEPWSFNGTPGQLIRTPNYRIFTTEPPGRLTSRLPAFLEGALGHYRTLLTGVSDPLPEPRLRMDTFIMSSRSDWELLARQTLGGQADAYTRIQRGGFAYDGRALLFDLGTFDTFAVTAHEGWHQYTQRSFAQSLPIWLEEGIATLMEGHRWGGGAPRGSEVRFLPWANVERFDQLRRALARGQLMPLAALLEAQPAQLISGGSNNPGLVYYAQVWALAQFLSEGADGRYRDGLIRAVRDASRGQLGAEVRRVLGPRAGGQMSLRRGPAVFAAYFSPEIQTVESEYRNFIERLVAPGSRGAIVAGRSPFEVAAQSQPRSQGGTP